MTGWETRGSLAWTPDAPLDEAHLDAAPDGPGLLALVVTRAGSDAVVWVEACHNVETRLYDLISLPQDNPELTRWLALRAGLRFRAAAVADPALRQELAEQLRAQGHHEPGPARPAVG